MATKPTYAAKKTFVGSCVVTATANASFTSGSAHSVLLFTAGATGAQIDSIELVTQGTPSACYVILWRKTHTTTTYFIVNPFQVSATTKKVRRATTFANLKLNPTDKLYITCTAASQSITVNAYGGNY